MTRLFIENREIELDESVQFAITKQFEDLSNPTDIINDWSKTVSIPFTARNNEIFGHIYNPDRLTVVGTSDTLIGIYFDPLKKLNMRLQWGDNVLMTGYAKMNEIKQVNGKGTYEITLFGQLGKVFQELLKITFDTATEDVDYLIDGSQYVNETMNKELIALSWRTNGQTHSDLLKKTDSGYLVTDIIGFAPNNSFMEDFDYKTFQTSSSTSKQFSEWINNTGFESTTGISADSVIPDGFLPREYGDFRSYLQTPYIYFNKLFQIFQEKAESITGYTFDLDDNWFISANPYWNDLVYILKSFNPKNGNEYNNVYKSTGSTTANLMVYNASGSSRYSPSIVGDTWHDGGYVNFSIVNEAFPSMESNIIYLQNDCIIKFTNIPIQLSFLNTRDTEPDLHYYHFRLNDGHYPSFEISLYDENDQLIPNSTKVIGLTYSGRQVPQSDLNTLGINEIAYTPASVYCNWQDTYTYNLMLPYNKTFTYANSSSYKMKIRYKWNNISSTNSIPFASYIESGEASWNRAAYVAPITLKFSQTTNMPVEITQGLTRSGVNFTLNSLWNNDYNLFKQIIDYCKVYRILIYMDDTNKKIVFKHITTYFSDYSITNWTDKIDKSKDYVIKPVTFNNKYVLFNYKDSETEIAKDYKEKFGYNFGEFRLTTDYNFNTETTNLFKDIKAPIVNTDNALSFNNLALKKIVYSFPSEISIDNKDAEKKFKDNFGTMYFYDSLASWSRESVLNLPYPFVSDDSDYLKNYSTYFYVMSNMSTIATYVDTYPKLNIVKDDNLCTFNIPKENYTYINNYSGKHSIYYNFWLKYLNELYNVQNKQITCYVNLKPLDWNEFKFNNFVKIGNQIYLVNKIYDYNVSSVESTKVDLITIQDIYAYTTNNFVINDPITLSWVGKTFYSGNITSTQSLLGTFTSGSDVTFSNNLKSITQNGVQFTINGNSIYTQQVTKYVDSADVDFNVVLKNKFGTTSFECQRYSTYPYPWIIIEDSEGNEVSTLPSGSFSGYKLKWHGTETEGLDNKPTVTITIIPLMSGTGANIDNTSWTEDIVMILEGDDEYFRTEYSVNLTYTLRAQQKVQITVVDKEGWHETKTYNVI